MSYVRVEIGSDRIATLWLDAPGKRVNTLSRQMWADLSAAIDQIERENSAAVVIASAKESSFVVGADLFEIREMNDAELDHYLVTGQAILRRLENLPMRSLAAVNGACLGGGLELALACKMRIAADDPKVFIGLPETTIGLVPGWGGTVRLTKLIGAERALPLILSGQSLDAKSALAIGIFDAVALPDRLISAAIDRVKQPSPIRSNYPIPSLDVFEQSAQGTAQKKVIEIVQQMADHGEAAGFDVERRGLVELRRSPESQKLLDVFFNRQAAKKQRSNGE